MAIASPEKYLADLNPAQREAVLATEGPVLVVAGAGSGKTRVLTHRIAHLVSACGVKPQEILAITFTNKAAGEMRERLEGILGDVAARMWVMTFHAACGRILRREAPRLGYRSNFTIYDQADQVRLAKQCLEELERDPKRFVPRGIHAQISMAKNQLIGPEEYKARVASFYDQTVADAYALYQRRLHSSNAVDFDDLLMLTVEVLERFPEALTRWQKAFRYVLVDEYQDTNHAQYRLLQLLAGQHRNVFAVGDPDQSIYAFRGADIRNILEFERDFGGGRLIALEQNYRSTNSILRAANSLITHNRERKPKNLWSELGEGDPVRVVEVEDEHAEARFVAAEVASLIEEGYAGSELAVFYRTNAQSRVLEDVLVRQEIPYQVIGGPKFYERAEIKDAIGYLQVIDNAYDAVSLTRIANRPRRGIGNASLARLQTFADTQGISLWEALERADEAGVGAAPLKAVERFRTLMQSSMAGALELSVPELLERVLEKSGYLESRVPAADLPLLRSGRPLGGAQPRVSDDAPQRKGARVPRRIPDRDGGGRVSAFALAGGARARGGAPPGLRRADAREGTVDAEPCRLSVALGRSRLQPAEPFPRRAAAGGDRARALAAGVVVGLRGSHGGGAPQLPGSLHRRLRPPLDAR